MALRRGDLGTEVPLLAVLRLSESDPNRKFTIDRYKKGGGLTPIRIRARDKRAYRRNSLKQHRAWRILHELVWRVIRTEKGRSDPYADPPKHS